MLRLNVINRVSWMVLNTVQKIFDVTNSNLIKNVQSKFIDIEATHSIITYSQFLKYLKMGWVKQVDLYECSSDIVAKICNPKALNRPQLAKITIPLGTSQLIQKFKKYNVDFDAHRIPQNNFFIKIKANLFLLIIFIISLSIFFINFKDCLKEFYLFSLSQIRLATNNNQRIYTGIDFNDIAGIGEIKEELEEIILFLKDPKRYTCVGAKIPKGILLSGPPGTGKTLLVKAMSNKANVPFYKISGPEVIERFIGIGAARIRSLFKKASKNAPCIIFIDEIDAVGRARRVGIGPINEERENTLNQLLTEMDGFKENKNVIVIGATNCGNCLDYALLRPGRFDRQLTINLPDKLNRIEILKVHAQKKLFSHNVSLTRLANSTPGFSGADLENLLNEAAILATRHKKQKISKNEINEATDRINSGIAKTMLGNTKNKTLVAYRKIGHAIVGSVLRNHDEVERITLVSRGSMTGHTWFAPGEGQSFMSRAKLTAQIIGTLGGRAAEKIIFGESGITTGVSMDLKQATRIARHMIIKYAMSIIGPIAINSNNISRKFLKNSISHIPVNRIDFETYKIINKCEKMAAKILLNNRTILDLLVDELLNKETLFGNEFRKFLCQYTRLPSKSVFCF